MATLGGFLAPGTTLGGRQLPNDNEYNIQKSATTNALRNLDAPKKTEQQQQQPRTLQTAPSQVHCINQAHSNVSELPNYDQLYSPRSPTEKQAAVFLTTNISPVDKADSVNDVDKLSLPKVRVVKQKRDTTNTKWMKKIGKSKEKKQSSTASTSTAGAGTAAVPPATQQQQRNPKDKDPTSSLKFTSDAANNYYNAMKFNNKSKNKLLLSNNSKRNNKKVTTTTTNERKSSLHPTTEEDGVMKDYIATLRSKKAQQFQLKSSNGS